MWFFFLEQGDWCYSYFTLFISLNDVSILFLWFQVKMQRFWETYIVIRQMNRENMFTTWKCFASKRLVVNDIYSQNLLFISVLLCIFYCNSISYQSCKFKIKLILKASWYDLCVFVVCSLPNIILGYKLWKLQKTVNVWKLFNLGEQALLSIFCHCTSVIFSWIT